MYDTHWDLPGAVDHQPERRCRLVRATRSARSTNTLLHSVRHQPGRALARRGRQRPACARPVPDRRHLRACDASTTQLKWNKLTGLDMAHGQGSAHHRERPAVRRPVRRQRRSRWTRITGKELWRFQTGAAISSPPITYTINGEQYVAILRGRHRHPVRQLGHRRATCCGRSSSAARYKTASGSSENPTPPPLTIRRPVGGQLVEGSSLLPPNTVYLARASRTQDALNPNGTSPADGTAAGR